MDLAQEQYLDTSIRLPQPDLHASQSLLNCLMQRRSGREFSARELPLAVLSNLLWAGCGINRPDSGGRTAPSARNWQEIEVYVAMKSGLYRYEPQSNLLQHFLASDLRELTGSQDFVAVAPVNLVYVANLAKVGAVDPLERRFYCAADAAFIAQNVYLFCASAGLATVVRGLVDRPKLAKAMQLGHQQRIVLAQTVGYPAQ